MSTLIHKRVEQCRQGIYPKQIRKLSSGWLVLGDVQFLQGYCLLLPDPVVADLNELTESERKTFLWEMSVVGDVLLEITDAVRINYEMLGNIEPALHAHIFPRSDSEDEKLRLKPVWFYNWDEAREFDEAKDRGLMDKIASGLKSRGL